LILCTLCTSAYSAENTEAPQTQMTDGEKILRKQFDANEYWSVGSEGLVYLQQDPDNHELRMLVADSLSWTGRYSDAITQYRMLAGTSLSDRATLGLANVYRWSGRPDLASPLYQQLLKTRPDNPDAIDGMNRINRELRPRTNYTLGKKSDSNSVIQHSNELTHRWRGDDLALKYELSINTSRYTRSPLNTRQKEVNFGIEHTGMALAPQLNLSLQQGPTTRAFASLRLKLDDASALHVTIGHVNWGNMAFQPQALLDGLTATQLGADASLLTRTGTLSAMYNAYRVSDGNQVQEANLHFSPSWRPLGPDFSYFIGLSGRFALMNVPSYWSPKSGFLSAEIGFSDDWSTPYGDLSIYAQRGFKAGGEALNSYNMGFSAKHYIDNDWAASLAAGLLKNQRIDAYRSKYLTLDIERLW
jgi:tetratricopeptide (TPR) repeat protein